MFDKYRALCNKCDVDDMIPTDVAVDIIDTIEKDFKKALECVEVNAMAWERNNASVAEGMRLAVALMKEVLGI